MNKPNNGEIELKELLNIDLTIPDYQRPYEWETKNVITLMEDIIKNYEEKKRINLGTIILFHPSTEEEYEIVDGLQRIITLSLLLRVINNNERINLFNKDILCIEGVEERIRENSRVLKEFVNKLVSLDNIDRNKFYNFLKDDVYFFVLQSSSLEESFQLFDGRNSKYKDLTPVDLLKAYHLGELPDGYPIKEKIKLLSGWEENINHQFEMIDETQNKVEYLYNCMMFNIYNWSLNKGIKPFDRDDIYLYKGYDTDNKYEYVKYYKGTKSYQLNKPFRSGADFFEMTDHYIGLVDTIIERYNLSTKIGISLKGYEYNFKFINIIYYNALLSFIDKFGQNMQPFYMDAITDYIYKWSLTHRIKNELVNYNTINKYVLRNNCNFFYKCNNALRVEELLNFEQQDLGNVPNESERLGELRGKLWKKLN